MSASEAERARSPREEVLARVVIEFTRRDWRFTVTVDHVFVGGHQTPIAEFEMNFDEALAATADIMTAPRVTTTRPQGAKVRVTPREEFDSSGIHICYKSG